MRQRRLDWQNTIFIATAHVLAIVAVAYLVFVHFSWWTIGLGLLWGALCGVAITGGYHRLFSHRTHKAHFALRTLYILFGAASVQNSAIKWSYDHRRHHARTDQDEDPYNISRGFWWAHIGWIFFKDDHRNVPETAVKDLWADPLLNFQHRYYMPLAVLFGALVPFALGLAWGDAIGALLVAGFLRLVLQWHATFAVNSFTHMIGRRPYCTKSSARDSFLAALITFGEGYHNFHHRFQSDYRNGVRWYHFDPTKWWVWGLSKIGVTRELRRTPNEVIARVKQAVRTEKSAAA